MFIFILKDNQIFDLKLEDKADYSLYFLNEIKKEINNLYSLKLLL